jgi:hypothetical protein
MFLNFSILCLNEIRKNLAARISPERRSLHAIYGLGLQYHHRNYVVFFIRQ